MVYIDSFFFRWGRGTHRTPLLIAKQLKTRVARQPQQERSEQKRAELLDIALAQFSTRGFEAVSVRDIADAAGVNHGMIRYYFGSKEELWRESVTRLFERLRLEVEPPRECESAAEAIDAIKDYTRNYIRYCARHPEHARLMIQEANRSSERLRWMVDEFIRPAHGRTVAMIKRTASTTPGLKDIDPVMLLYMITAMSQVPYLLTEEMREAHGIDPMQESAIEAHCNAVLAFIYRESN